MHHGALTYNFADRSKAMWGGIGKACGVEVPEGRTETLFEKEGATPAVLTFLRETKVGGRGW